MNVGQAGVIDEAYVNKLLDEVKRLESVRVSQADAIIVLQEQVKDQELQLATLRPPEICRNTLPFPDKYEVGMMFRRVDGFIARCVSTCGLSGGYITAPEGEIPPRFRFANARGAWHYNDGRRTMWLHTEFPQSELVEYLGKAQNQTST